MRKSAIILLALAFVVATAVSAHAITIDQTASVSATATVSGSTSLSVSPTSIAYGTGSTDRYPTTPSNNKVVLTYSSNYNPWKLMVSTNNTAIPDMPATNGRYQKGGLYAGTGPYNICACKWVAKVGTNTTAPTLPTAASLHNFVKDKRDQDDPTTTGSDESWTYALTWGYPNVAYGDASGAGFCVDPTDTSTTDGDGLYVGDPVTPSSGVAVYIAGGFATNFLSPAIPAAAGSYGTSFVFDLYHD